MSVARVWLAMPRRHRALLGATLGAATVLAGVGLMATSGYLIARTAERPPILDLMVVFVGVRFFGLARPALRYADRLVSHDVTFRLLQQVRRWFIEALLPLAPARLADYRSGDLLARLAGDVERLRDVHLRLVAPALVATLVTGIVVAAVYQIDRGLAGVVFALLVANGAVWPLVSRQWTRGLGYRRNRERAEMSARLVPMLQGISDVLACGRERDEVARLARHQHAIDAVQRREDGVIAGHAAVATITSQMSLWTSLWLLVPLVERGQLSGVWLAAVPLGIVAAFEAVEGLPGAWHAHEQIRDAAVRVWDVLAAQPAVTDSAPSVVPNERNGSQEGAEAMAPALRLTNVTFRYAATNVLRDLSLDVAPGEHVAIVGPSGSGKSTLLALATRVWDPASGVLAVHGTDARAVPLADLRASMAIMPQHVHVFDDTVRENVRLATPSASDADIVSALRQARLHTWLSTLPHGLDSPVGEHGNRLSAGERQRLGLARLMLSDASLVLVDEPTAHLDTETERDVLHTLRTWARGRTLLLVTHRLVDLHAMDRVLVLDRGRLVESGSYEELSRHGGLFAQLLDAPRGLLRV